MGVEQTMGFNEVREVWRKADEGRSDGRGTLGILGWFKCFVQRWQQQEALTEDALYEMRLIGGEPGTMWARLSSGTFRVRNCELPEEADPDTEPSPLTLVCVQDPATKRLVLVDGNKRAVVLWKRRQGGHPLPADALLCVGVLDPRFAAAAAAVSSVWAPDRPPARMPLRWRVAASYLAARRVAKRLYVLLRKGGRAVS